MSFRLLPAAVLAFFCASAQDGGWWEEIKAYAANGDPQGTAAQRSFLERIEEKETLGLRQALRAILLKVELEGAGGKEVLKDLSKYMGKVGSLPSTREANRAALKLAMSAEGIVGDLMPLGHLEVLLTLGEDRKILAEEMKKLRVTAYGEDKIATEDGALLARLREVKDGMSVATQTERSRNPSLVYFTMIGLMRSIEKTNKAPAAKAIELSDKLKRWSPEHIALLVQMLEAVVPCPSCADKGKVVCFACKGTGARRIVCPECDGNGWIKWDPRTPKTEKRAEVDKARGHSGDKSYCPSCVGNPQHKVQTVKCDFCEQKRRVECNRCKYQKFGFEIFGTIADCEPCGKTGFMFGRVLHPCAFCHGVGGLLKPAGNSVATVGPAK